MPATKPKAKGGAKIEKYIAAAADEARPHLRAMLECLRKAAPGASEDLKWRMPSMAYQRILFQFAAFRKHIGFYPTPAAIREFEAELSGYKHAKGSIQFPLDEPLPRGLIGRIARFRVRQVRDYDAKWM